MNRPRIRRAPTRTLAQFTASQDLESAICEALAARPINDSILRPAVSTYASEERRAGTSPGRVILTLTELIEKSLTTPAAQHHALMRRVILWCVDAYYEDGNRAIPMLETRQSGQTPQ